MEEWAKDVAEILIKYNCRIVDEQGDPYFGDIFKLMYELKEYKTKQDYTYDMTNHKVARELNDEGVNSKYKVGDILSISSISSLVKIIAVDCTGYSVRLQDRGGKFSTGSYIAKIGIAFLESDEPRLICRNEERNFKIGVNIETRCTIRVNYPKITVVLYDEINDVEAKGVAVCDVSVDKFDTTIGEGIALARASNKLYKTLIKKNEEVIDFLGE